MSSYLLMAEQVLENSLQPLSAKEILKRAYLDELVPSHLFGKTQHKTLHARISVDIRSNGEKSRFYRAEPGVFFLRKFMPTGAGVAGSEFFARPRRRELHRNPVLVVGRNILAEACAFGNSFLEHEQTRTLLAHDEIRFMDAKRVSKKDELPVWSFVVICRGEDILTYRQGKYRQQRDGFANQRTIGFSTLIERGEVTFFDTENHGLVGAGLKSAIADLGFSDRPIDLHEEQLQASLDFSVLFDTADAAGELVCVVSYECPPWLEPSTRRLAINDLQWLTTSRPVNNIDDFDPWSQKIIPRIFALRQQKAVA